MTLRTEYVPIDALRPHPRNAHNGDTDKIAQSLAENGQYRAIVATADGTVLAGNHTYAAACSLGWSALWVHRLDLDPDSTPALRILAADNGTARDGRDDDGLLVDLLRSLDDAGALAGTGYAPDDLDDLMARLDEAAHIDLNRLGVPPPLPERASSYGEGGTRLTNTFGDNAGRYNERATRMIVLNASPTGYAWIVNGLATVAADRYGEPDLTNVEVVARLLADALGEPVPADLVPDVDEPA